MPHDLSQQQHYLRAALEQEKKPTGFLLGAGAPMSIKVGGKQLIPGLEDLTANVKGALKKDESDALSTLISDLPPADGKNLESILNYVRALAALPGTSDVRGIPMETFAILDREICRIIRQQVDQTLPKAHSAYLSLALWIGAVQRLSPIQVFTTNYDLLLEQALERQKVTYFDGFMGSREPVFDLQAIEEDVLPARWTLLWKLHGSINWSHDNAGNVVRRHPDATDERSALIYPSNLKYDQSRRLPYLAMMDRLKAFLKRPGAILVSAGFSFRDQHINEMVEQSLRANPTASVHALLHGKLDGYAEAVRLASGLPNLTLAAADSAVVGTVVGKWANTVDADGEASIEQLSSLGHFEAFGEFLQGLTGELPMKDDDPDE